MTSKNKDKCHHGRSKLFCCKCSYGERSHYKEREYEVKDVYDFIKGKSND